jgi:hypothetical protein
MARNVESGRPLWKIPRTRKNDETTCRSQVVHLEDMYTIGPTPLKLLILSLLERLRQLISQSTSSYLALRLEFPT